MRLMSLGGYCGRLRSLLSVLFDDGSTHVDDAIAVPKVPSFSVLARRPPVLVHAASTSA